MSSDLQRSPTTSKAFLSKLSKLSKRVIQKKSHNLWEQFAWDPACRCGMFLFHGLPAFKTNYIKLIQIVYSSTLQIEGTGATLWWMLCHGVLQHLRSWALSALFHRRAMAESRPSQWLGQGSSWIMNRLWIISSPRLWGFASSLKIHPS